MSLQVLKVMAVTRDNSAMTESDETTFWERLGEAMLANGLKHTQTAASALIGSKGNTAAKKWHDGGYPNMTNAVGIAKKLGVCVEWLLTGEGTKHPMAPLSELEETLIRALRERSDEQQDQTIRRILVWLEVDADMSTIAPADNHQPAAALSVHDDAGSYSVNDPVGNGDNNSANC